MTGDTLLEMEVLLRAIDEKVDSLAQLSSQINAAEQKRLDTQNREIKKHRYTTALSVVAAAVLIYLVFGNAIKYKLAELSFNNGSYDTAIQIYRDLDGYRDSHERMQSSYYTLAEELLAKRDWYGANNAFVFAGSYHDAAMRVGEPYYLQAEALLTAGRWTEANAAFINAGDYADATVRIGEPYNIAAEALLDNGEYDKAWRMYLSATDYPDALKKAWSIRYQYMNDGDIAAGHSFSLGLRADGTVAYAGEEYFMERVINKWTDVVAVFATGSHAAALKADGTVVSAGSGGYEDTHSEWNNVVYITLNNNSIVALKADGTLYVNEDFSDYDRTLESWTDIIDIANSRYSWVGLMRNGTVNGICDSAYISAYKIHEYLYISDWEHVDILFSTERGVYGLNSNVYLHQTGPGYRNSIYSKKDNMNNKWIDIVSMSGEQERAIGVKGDGKVVIVGEPGSMKNWTNILVTASSYNHTIALKSDGTVVADGNNDYGQCDVSGFVDIGCSLTLQ